MSEFQDKTVMWIDNGLFVSFAQKVAESFGKTYYFTPWVSGFPKSNNILPGAGLPGIERIKYPWDLIDEVDLFIFPDVYFRDWQNVLVNMGKRVWGARAGDSLELHRWETKIYLKKLGLPVPHCARVTGMEALREYLREHDNVWVKVSIVRGDFETFKSQNYDLSEPKLDELEHMLGAKKFIEEFIVEDDLPHTDEDPVVEVGYDGWTIDGQFPPTAVFGYEVKDLGYIGMVKEYSQLAEPILRVNEALAPYFKQEQFRGFFSSELRIGKDQQPYLIDPCCRCGSPPSEVYQELFSNWAEILWYGAEGIIVPPEATAKFGVQIMLHSGWADKNWQAINFPESIRQFMKLRNHTIIEGKDYVVPTAAGLPEVGAVVAVGDDLMDTLAVAQERAGMVSGYFIEHKGSSLAAAMEQVRRGEELGIVFSDNIPSPADLAELQPTEAD